MTKTVWRVARVTTLLEAKSLRHRIRLLHSASCAANKESELQISSSPAVADGKLEIMSIATKATVTAGANANVRIRSDLVDLMKNMRVGFTIKRTN